MSPAEVSRALRLRLAGELRVDLDAIERRAAAVHELLFDAADAGDTTKVAHLRTLALAFELERFYTAVEATLERLLQGLDGDAPRGASWHTELLRASCVPLPGLRPQLISATAANGLRDLLGFRHFARHAYDADPSPPRIDALASAIAPLATDVATSLAAIVAMLEA